MHASLNHHGGEQLGGDAAPLAHLAVPAVGQVRDHSCHAPQREVEEEEEGKRRKRKRMCIIYMYIIHMYIYIYYVAYCDFVV